MIKFRYRIGLAEIELNNLKLENENNKKDKNVFIAKDVADKNAIIEIRAGTGGLEASLFAADFLKCMRE